MICDKRIEQLSWSCQGHLFVSNVGVLPLKYFDMILGQDLLETSSPMWVHWGNKQMKFTHGGKRIMLKGLSQDMEHCPLVSAAKLKGLLNRQAITHCIQFQFHNEGEMQTEQLSSSDCVDVVQDTCLPNGI